MITLTDIWLLYSEGVERLMVFDQFGVQHLTTSGEPIGKYVQFAIAKGRVRYQPVNTQAVINYAYLGGGFGDIGLLDEYGNEIWSSSGYLGMVVEDFEYDGMFECVLFGFNGLEGRDFRGRPRWANNCGIVWDAEVLGDRQGLQLLTSEQASGKGLPSLTVRQSDGTFIRQLTSQCKMEANISIARSLDHGTSAMIVTHYQSSLCILDEQGNERLKVSTPIDTIFETRSSLISFGKQTAQSLVILIKSSAAIRKSAIMILSLEGSVLYQADVGYTTALTVVPQPGGVGERVLVGDGAGIVSVIEFIADD